MFLVTLNRQSNDLAVLPE